MLKPSLGHRSAQNMRRCVYMVKGANGHHWASPPKTHWRPQATHKRMLRVKPFAANGAPFERLDRKSSPVYIPLVSELDEEAWDESEMAL